MTTDTVIVNSMWKNKHTADLSSHFIFILFVETTQDQMLHTVEPSQPTPSPHPKAFPAKKLRGLPRDSANSWEVWRVCACVRVGGGGGRVCFNAHNVMIVKHILLLRAPTQRLNTSTSRHQLTDDISTHDSSHHITHRHSRRHRHRHQHINTSTHRHIGINTSTHRHIGINTSTHQHIENKSSTHQHQLSNTSDSIHRHMLAVLGSKDRFRGAFTGLLACTGRGPIRGLAFPDVCMDMWKFYRRQGLPKT
jgi:hypothetical protein